MSIKRTYPTLHCRGPRSNAYYSGCLYDYYGERVFFLGDCSPRSSPITFLVHGSEPPGERNYNECKEGRADCSNEEDPEEDLVYDDRQASPLIDQLS